MSKIDKLSIQGIRSFGPDESKRIQFYSPLTLILGQNGCGKTTIIECLKYITTGEFPPGCGRGTFFVHDPKVADETKVRGQIKLLFNYNKNNKDERIVTSRTLEVTQKAKKLECKTIDATITRALPDGNKQSISHKCADIQAEMTSLLGVSRSILENVIFCHQEESNWPLDEGKKVKEKFDAIFNATRYIKCLDTIKKLRTDEKKRMNNMVETVTALHSSKENAVRLRNELEEVEKQLNNITEQKKGIQAALDLGKTRLNEISKIEQDLRDIHREKNDKEQELKYNRQSQRELRDRQTKSFETYTDSDLERLMANFDKHSSEKQLNLKCLEREIENIERNLSIVKGKHSNQLQEVGRREADYKTHTQEANSLNKQLVKLISNYNIEGFHGDIFDYHKAEEVLEKVDGMIEEGNKKIISKKKEFSNKINSLQDEIEDFREKEKDLECDIRNCKTKLDDLYNKSRETRMKLSVNEDELSSDSIDEIRKSIESLSQRIDKEEDKVNISELEDSVALKKRTLDLTERDIKEVKFKINKMHRQSEARAQYDIHLKEKQQLEHSIKLLKRKHAEDFEYIFGKNVGENIRNELEVYNRRTQQNKDSVKVQKDAAERKKDQIETKNENDKALLSRKQQEIAEFEKKLENICRGLDLETSLKKIVEQKEKMERETSDRTSLTNVMNAYISKLKDNPTCPLCNRDFDGVDEAELLVDQLEQRVQQIPTRLAKEKAALAEHKAKHEKLLQLKMDEAHAKQAGKEVDELRVRIKNNHEEIQNIETQLEEISISYDVMVSDEMIGKRIQSDVLEIDSNFKKITVLKNKLGDLDSTMGNVGSEISLDELLKQQTDLEGKIKSTRDEIDSTQSNIMDHRLVLQRLNKEKDNLSHKEFELQMKVKETEKLKADLERFESEKINYNQREEDSNSKLAPIKFIIKDKIRSKDGLTEECQSWVDKERERIGEIKEERRRCFEIHSRVKSYILNREEKKLLECQNKVSNLQDEMQTFERQKKELNGKINDINEELASKKDKRGMLDDERKIREKRKKETQLENEIEILQKKIEGFNYMTVLEEKQTLLKEQEKLSLKDASLKGSVDVLKTQKMDHITLLNKKEIKNAESNYKEKLIEVKCLEVAINDLNKYYKALYSGIMRFHSEKMAMINRIIRELWRTTYKGNDIDYVEIKTDESEVKGTDKRQSYNYRVVMVKNEVEMDMRGRCSAGQKVLASLIIRMALAETFSCNCGILALDEPTTNLDKQNIEALAGALLKIVNQRSNERNFQLIVITHDEVFLNMLTKANFTEYYYVVSRDHRGLSMITKKIASM